MDRKSLAVANKPKSNWIKPNAPNKVAFPSPTFRAPDAATRIRPYLRASFDTHVAKVICKKLMLKQSLKSICSDPRMPSLGTVVGWLADPALTEFREMYYYARRVAAELLVDEMIEISDDTTNDWRTKYNRHGEPAGTEVDNEAIQRSRVRIDTRKWIAAKMVPRMYGEHATVDLNATGDLAAILKQAVNKDRGLPPPIEHDQGA